MGIAYTQNPDPVRFLPKKAPRLGSQPQAKARWFDIRKKQEERRCEQA